MQPSNIQAGALRQADVSRIASLDGLRGLCILLVVFHNLYPYGSGLHNVVESSIRLVANMGWIGVQWFFVLSGFLITGILVKLKDVDGGLKHFYIRRALRIFPIYYLTLVLFILVLPLVGFVTSNTQSLIDHQAWYWLYMVNWMPAFGIKDGGFPHLWSLAVEEQFYCIWPWLIFWLSRRWMVVVCVFCVMSSPILRYLIVVFDESDAKDIAYDITIVRWDALALGALYAFAMVNTGWKAWVDKQGAKCAIAVFVIILIVIALNRSFTAVGPDFLVFNQTLAALLGVVLLNESLNRISLLKGKLGDFFHSSFLRMLGKYSYAIYIFHLIIDFLMRPLVSSAKEGFATLNPALIDFTAFIVNVVAAVILAAISWHFVEEPLLKLKDRFPLSKSQTV